MRANKRNDEPEQEPGPPRYLVGWECPVCWTRLSGFLLPGEDDMRVCVSHARPGRKMVPLIEGETCGAIMDVFLDKRPRV